MSEERVRVRWRGPVPVTTAGRLLHPGDEFEMPRAEAEARTDVEIVTTAPVPAEEE